MRCFTESPRLAAALVVLAIGLGISADTAAAPSKIGRIDRFWANWEGFDPEAYVMMKSMGERFEKMQQAASIARDSGDENALAQKAREQLTDQVVDWATDINPAVKPIKAMGELAIDGTQRWLDWSFRYEVNQMYVKYKKAFEETGDVKQAADAVNNWLKDSSEVASTYMKEKELAVLRNNRALMIASIIDQHRRQNPDKYEGKDIARELRGGREPRPDAGTDPSKPGDKTSTNPPSKPGDKASSSTQTKPGDKSKPVEKAPTKQPAGAVQYQPVTPAIRQAVLDCMCACNSSANLSAVGVRYDPKPSSASPNCSQPSNGACVNQGYGCWRHVPPSGGDCVDRCHSRSNIQPGSVKP